METSERESAGLRASFDTPFAVFCFVTELQGAAELCVPTPYRPETVLRSASRVGTQDPESDRTDPRSDSYTYSVRDTLIAIRDRAIYP